MGSRSCIQGSCDNPRGDTRQEYLSLIFLYSYHRPSPLIYYSTSEPILTGPPGTSPSTRKVIHRRPPHDSPRDTDIRPRSLRRERTAPRPVARAQGHPYARLLRVPYHPCAPFFDCLSPPGRGYSREEPLISSDSTPRRRSTFHPILHCLRAENTQRWRRRSSVGPVRYLV